MDELITFLRARYDDAETVVRRNLGDTGLGDDGDFPDYRTYEDEDTRAADAFLGLFTPEFMLADVASKRRIIDEVVPEINAMDDKIESEWGTYSEGPHEETWLLLKLLALPFAGHPGYQESWKP